jgi:hypothetical protein
VVFLILTLLLKHLVTFVRNTLRIVSLGLFCIRQYAWPDLQQFRARSTLVLHTDRFVMVRDAEPVLESSIREGIHKV